MRSQIIPREEYHFLNIGFQTFKQTSECDTAHWEHNCVKRHAQCISHACGSGQRWGERACAEEWGCFCESGWEQIEE